MPSWAATHRLVYAAFMLTAVVFAASDTLIKSKLPTPSEDYVHWTSLDETENYLAYWKFDEDSVTFEVHARTRGWVGFGLSPSGGMKGADVVIGWVANGKGYFKDHHAIGNERPLVDESQDYELLQAHETDDFTSLKFRRKLKNCDEHDYDIEAGTIRVIFAWGDSDPADHESILYHGATQRGSKSIVVLDNTKPDKQKKNLIDNDNESQIFDIKINDANITAERTIYYCRILSFPDLAKKHHIVKIEPLIDEKNRGIVHHIVIYQCHGQRRMEEKFSKRCWEGGMADNATSCDTAIFGWGVGQTSYYLPEEVGLPIGGDEPPLLQIEMHYDNPMLLTDVIDNSGVRITYTSKVRKYDASTLALGHTVMWPKLVIPPGHQAFRLDTYCKRECTEKMIPETGINIVGVMLHTHTIGEKVWLKHVRDGKELPEIVREDHYDFNYQQIQILKKPRHVKPGDEFITSCVYNSKKRQDVTFGGSGTDNEMCIAFVLYYPRTPLSACISTTQDFLPIHQMVVERAMAGDLTINTDSDDYDAYKYLDKLKWTDALRDEFYSKTVKDINGVRQICSARGRGDGFFGGSGFYRYIRKVEIKEPWKKQSQCPVKEDPAAVGAAFMSVTALPVLLLVTVISALCMIN